MTKEQLTEKVELLEGANADLNAELDALKEENATLKSQLEEIVAAKEQGQPKKVALPKPFEYDGKILEFTVPAFILDGTKYKSADVVNNKEIIDALLKKETKILVVKDK